MTNKKCDPFCHFTKKLSLFSSTKNIGSCQFCLQKKIYLKVKNNSFNASTKKEDSFYLFPKKKERNIWINKLQVTVINTNIDIDIDIVHPGNALYLYIVLQTRFYDIQYLTYHPHNIVHAACTGGIPNYVCNNAAYGDGISYNEININRDLVHYGVIYAYMYAYYVVQLLLYNIQEPVCYNNGVLCVNKYNIMYQAY